MVVEPSTWLIDCGATRSDAQRKAEEIVGWLSQFGWVSRGSIRDYSMRVERIRLVSVAASGEEGARSDLSSKVAALEVLVGRTMLRSNTEQLRSLSCPCCGQDRGIDAVGWEAAVEQWYVDDDEGQLLCLHCMTSTCVSRWSFNGCAWVMGNLAIRVSPDTLSGDQQCKLLTFLGAESVLLRV